MGNNIKKIVIVGNPNSGKTTLFNALTGLNQKTSNIAGTTVDLKISNIKIDNQNLELVDIPGIYSLIYKTKDEEIAVKYLLNNQIDLVVMVIDSTLIKRQLVLLEQLKNLGLPCLVVLTMKDLAKNLGIEIDLEKLSQETECIVYHVSARQKSNIELLKKELTKSHLLHHSLNINDYQSYKLLIDEFNKNRQSNHVKEKIEEDLEVKFKKADKITQIVENRKKQKSKHISQKIDQFVLHPILGFIIFFVLMYFMFFSVFKISEYPTSWIENLFQWITLKINTHFEENIFTNVLTNGILPGLSGVLVFLPQIIFLFLILTLLEDSGYMSRVSFISDRLMRKFGLNGKSVIPLIGGMACAIPAIMSTRTINNQKERLITILVTPLMSCSARLPVYTTLAAIFISSKSNYLIDQRALLILSLYLFGFIMALTFGLIFKLILKLDEKSFFILELPSYKSPSIKNVLITLKDKIKDFVFNAGKIILIVSLILWFLSSFGPFGKFSEIDKKYENYTQTDKQEKIDSEKLENSYAGIIGKTIEPAIKPLGYDWKIGIALVTSFAAREVFVGTMATLYNLSDKENTDTLSETLKKQKNKDGTAFFSMALIFSLLIFYALSMQCISTLSITYRETKSLKWTLVQLIYMTGVAYLMSFIAYQLLK